MIQRRAIQRWCDTVASEFRPTKIILFGSYANGKATEDSDVDVLVIMPLARGTRDVKQAAAIREQVRAEFPMDVIVRSPSEIRKRLQQQDSFIIEVIRHGRLMYEGDHP